MENKLSLPWIVSEWCFLVIAVLATVNWLKRPDWNFAFALLSYCYVKCLEKEGYHEDHNSNVKLMVIILNALVMLFDVVWIITLSVIWHGKPDNSELIWQGFSTLHIVIIIS